MSQSKWKYVVFCALLTAVLTMGVSEAKALWHWGPWGYGVDPWGAFCDPCVGGPYYGFGLPFRPIRRVMCGGPAGWYSNCWGYGWNGCCWDAICMPIVDYCAPGGVPGPAGVALAAPGPTIAPALPAVPPPAPPAASDTEPSPQASPLPGPGETKEPSDYNPPAPAAEPGARTMLPPNRWSSAILTIWVPTNAKVMINGLPTLTTGSRREYISHGLQPGLSYKYEVCVQIVRDGKTLEETQEVLMTAGSKEGLAFGFNQKPAEVAMAE